VLVAFFVVVDAFGALGRISLVDARVAEFILDLLVERERKELFGLLEWCQSTCR
jgi:hypothetical protein